LDFGIPQIVKEVDDDVTNKKKMQLFSKIILKFLKEQITELKYLKHNITNYRKFFTQYIKIFYDKYLEILKFLMCNLLL